VYSGPAELELGASDFEELDALAPVSVGRGFVHSLAFSVVGGRASPIDGADQPGKREGDAP
jgi:hypothetical protein